ncbi:hypothetical protein OSSY52_15620 [Tepiditoga spiralis]|uniref:THIF-type NAD/FAD binding fold domain-containing protein n=1 Tax=Tepiditoga spiralis TaxID=2108365 RepID=A0A7G1G4V4_9BACT|nr:ThiF family adenylyltransferase [Tepiditoga spiralis]BBE31421.1 hypothetical protein OSSY52_15620 [Tepiditoga spiralis]
MIDIEYFDRQLKYIGLNKMKEIFNTKISIKDDLSQKILKNCGFNIIDLEENTHGFTIKLIENNITVSFNKYKEIEKTVDIPKEICSALISTLIVSNLLFNTKQISIPHFKFNLEAKNAVVIGAGGLGNPVSYVLNKNKIPFCIIDKDIVEKSNLSRQFLFDKKDIKKYKSKAIKDKLNYCIESKEIELTEKNLDILNKYEIIYSCVDNLKTRYILSDFCKKNNKTFIDSGVAGSICTIYKNIDLNKIMNTDDKNALNTCNTGILPTTAILGGFLQAYSLNNNFSMIFVDFSIGKVLSVKNIN